MKKISFIAAFIALFFTSIEAQNCTEKTTKKAKSSVVIGTSSVKNRSQNEAKMSSEKPIETASITVVNTPMTVVIDSPKMDNKSEMNTEIITSKSVIIDSLINKSTQTATVMTMPQVVDNKPVIIEKLVEKPVKVLAFDHSIWQDLLKKHVSATGKVNYKGFKTDVVLLDSYIKSLNDIVPTDKMSKEERLAYWINAYNAVTVRLIVTNYPISSITKLDDGKTWDVKRFSNGSKKLSLNDIENTILRPMGDARIHFALNCAAKSCPPLLNEAFTAENVTQLLEQRTKEFINSPRTVIEKGEIKVSKIFDWYAKDFGNIVDFVNKYAKTKAAKTAKVSYLAYDWNLNE